VPGYSEVYPVDELIWNNTNEALIFRSDVLNLYALSDADLVGLNERLNSNELDPYLDISTLIGVAFDENTVWGQLTVLELRLLIHLALEQFDEAFELTGMFLQYNDNTTERVLFYQALSAVLEVTLDDELTLDHYATNFYRMFGQERMDAVMGSIDGSVKFFGLTPTNLGLDGLDRHHRLIDSLKKLRKARVSAPT
jgi:ribosomal protein S12 methylthiotransferase accessory factor